MSKKVKKNIKDLSNTYLKEPLVIRKKTNEIKADSDNNFKEEEHPRKANGEFKEEGSGEDNKQGDKEETDKKDSSEEKQKEEKEIKEKIEQLEKIDWTKDNTLPNLNKNTLKELNLEDKPVLLKKNIIKKNKLNHPDITEEEAKRIIGNALYRPELILKANAEKTAYHNFISRTDDKHSDIVLLELSEEKENYEIINYHIINNPARNRKINIHKKS